MGTLLCCGDQPSPRRAALSGRPFEPCAAIEKTLGGKEREGDVGDG